MPLGRVLGLLLDRHASTEPGQATVVESDEEGVQEIRLFWNNASVWRLERQGGGVVSDGLHEQEWRGRNRQPPHPTRQTHPAWHFQLVFPLRAHVFGRLGDDYFPSGAEAHDEGVLVALEGTEDDRQGHLVVDSSSGFIREAAYLSGRHTLRLTDLQLGPLDGAESLFQVSG